jgi:CDGSH-type Zn-finger protein
MSDVKITVLKNGPYKVEGVITLMHGDAPVATPGPAVFLCRCGASSTKPFCDGTHSKIGFQAAAQAVPESREPGRT